MCQYGSVDFSSRGRRRGKKGRERTTTTKKKHERSLDLARTGSGLEKTKSKKWTQERNPRPLLSLLNLLSVLSLSLSLLRAPMGLS
jgi:hypothetical protein